MSKNQVAKTSALKKMCNIYYTYMSIIHIYIHIYQTLKLVSLLNCLLDLLLKILRWHL